MLTMNNNKNIKYVFQKTLNIISRKVFLIITFSELNLSFMRKTVSK